MPSPFSGLGRNEKIAVAVGGAGVAWFAWRQHKASSASPSASAIDPLTGLPASQDNTPDPVTGEAYLAEAQQYGSVQAAEQALSGQGLAGGYYGTGGNGLVGTSTGASLVPANVVQGTSFGSNSAWAQAVEAGLTDLGYAPTDVSAALGRYLGNLSETAAQAGIVQAAIAEYGPPPTGSFQVIQAPASGPASSGNTDVTIPDVSGLDAAQAQHVLTGLGLKPLITFTAASNHPGIFHIITKTSPAAGTSVARGTTVTLYYRDSKTA
jgi:hypothetical protein